MVVLFDADAVLALKVCTRRKLRSPDWALAVEDDDESAPCCLFPMGRLEDVKVRGGGPLGGLEEMSAFLAAEAALGEFSVRAI